MDSLVKKNFIHELEEIDWDFAGEDGTDGFANYHWYPARFIPQLAGVIINYFSEPDDVILDPFCGSGTTLVEAFRFGRRGVGIDLNPIGILMTKAKLTAFDKKSFDSYRRELEEKTKVKMNSYNLFSNKQTEELSVPNYQENKDWYHNRTLRELASIWATIREYSQSKYYKVGLTAFSSILRASCSQDKHWGWVCDNVKPDSFTYKNSFEKFSNKLSEYKHNAINLHKENKKFQKTETPVSNFEALQGDCFEELKKFPDQNFDLIVTSPPYFNTTDYIKSQRLSFLWFGSDMENLQSKEIGARYKRSRKNGFEEYSQEMREAFSEINRVLKTDRYCVVVIGESPKRESFVDKFESICKEIGFEGRQIIPRKISKQRSLFPTLKNERIYIYQKT